MESDPCCGEGHLRRDGAPPNELVQLRLLRRQQTLERARLDPKVDRPYRLVRLLRILPLAVDETSRLGWQPVFRRREARLVTSCSSVTTHSYSASLPPARSAP